MKPNEVLGEVMAEDKCNYAEDEREHKDDEKKKKVVAFKAATSSKSKDKASMKEIEEEDEGLEEIDHELVLLARKQLSSPCN